MLRITTLFVFLILFRTNGAIAQETRTYVLSVDFGATDSLQNYWYPWYFSNIKSSSERDVQNVFDNSGVQIKITTPCLAGSSGSCGLDIKENPSVFDTTHNELLSNVLHVRNKNATFRFDGLRNGDYDIKFYFHNSAINSQSDRVSLKLTDSRAPNGIWLSNNLKYTNSTSPDIISSFRIPVRVRNNREVIVELSASNDEIMVNGFIISKYGQREVLYNDIELIPRHRDTEALISGELMNDEDIYACAISQQGFHHTGRWLENEGICQALVENNILESSDYKFIKFDPFFYWQSLSTPAVPSNAIAFMGSDGDSYYLCAAPDGNDIILPGIYIPNQLDACQVIDNGDIRTFNQFYIHSRRSN